MPVAQQHASRQVAQWCLLTCSSCACTMLMPLPRHTPPAHHPQTILLHWLGRSSGWRRPQLTLVHIPHRGAMLFFSKVRYGFAQAGQECHRIEGLSKPVNNRGRKGSGGAAKHFYKEWKSMFCLLPPSFVVPSHHVALPQPVLPSHMAADHPWRNQVNGVPSSTARAHCCCFSSHAIPCPPPVIHTPPPARRKAVAARLQRHVKAARRMSTPPPPLFIAAAGEVRLICRAVRRGRREYCSEM